VWGWKLKMKGKEKKNKIKLPAYNNIPTSLTLNTAQHSTAHSQLPSLANKTLYSNLSLSSPAILLHHSSLLSSPL